MSLRRSARIKAKEKTISYADPITESEEPSESESNESSSSHSEYELGCICGQPNDDRILICCDKCSIWYHYDCAQLTVTEVNELSASSKDWLCSLCTKQHHKKRKKRKRKRKRSKSRECPSNKRQKRTHSNDVNSSSVEHQILSVILQTKRKRMSRSEIEEHIQTNNGYLRKILKSMIGSGVLNYGKTKQIFKITKKGKKEFENVANIRKIFDTSSNNSRSMSFAPFGIPFASQSIPPRKKRVVESSEEPDYSLSVSSVPLETSQAPVPRTNCSDFFQVFQANNIHQTVQAANSVPLEMPLTNLVQYLRTLKANNEQNNLHTHEQQHDQAGIDENGTIPLHAHSVPLDMPSSQETAENVEANEENESDNSDLEILDGSSNCDNNQLQSTNKDATFPIMPIIKESIENNPCITEQNGSANESDASDSDDILIQAGDQWIENDTFLQNKEEFKKDIALKRKEEINENLRDIDSENEDELIVLNKDKTSNQDLCPLTLKKIENPIQNRLCSHIYERSAILNYRKYLIENDKPTKCPQGGCQAALFGF